MTISLTEQPVAAAMTLGVSAMSCAERVGLPHTSAQSTLNNSEIVVVSLCPSFDAAAVTLVAAGAEAGIILLGRLLGRVAWDVIVTETWPPTMAVLAPAIAGPNVIEELSLVEVVVAVIGFVFRVIVGTQAYSEFVEVSVGAVLVADVVVEARVELGRREPEVEFDAETADVDEFPTIETEPLPPIELDALMALPVELLDVIEVFLLPPELAGSEAAVVRGKDALVGETVPF